MNNPFVPRVMRNLKLMQQVAVSGVVIKCEKLKRINERSGVSCPIKLGHYASPLFQLLDKNVRLCLRSVQATNGSHALSIP